MQNTAEQKWAQNIKYENQIICFFVIVVLILIVGIMVYRNIPPGTIGQFWNTLAWGNFA